MPQNGFPDAAGQRRYFLMRQAQSPPTEFETLPKPPTYLSTVSAGFHPQEMCLDKQKTIAGCRAEAHSQFTGAEFFEQSGGRKDPLRELAGQDRNFGFRPVL